MDLDKKLDQHDQKMFLSKELGKICVLCDTGASLNIINASFKTNPCIQTMIKHDRKAWEVVGANNSTFQIWSFITLTIEKFDKTWVQQKFYFAPCQLKFIFGRPLLKALGFRLCIPEVIFNYPGI